MSAFNALVDSYVGAPDPGPVPSDDSAAAAGAVHSSTVPHIADLQGVPPLLGDHNIPLHVGMLGIIALGVIVGLRLLGFRFSAVGALGVGGR